MIISTKLRFGKHIKVIVTTSNLLFKIQFSKDTKVCSDKDIIMKISRLVDQFLLI